MTNLITIPLQTLPDRLPAGFDHQLDRVNALILEAFELATRDEILATARTMRLTTSNDTIITNDETDNARVIEWAAFHVRRNGKSLVQLLLERMPSAADHRDRAILSALAMSAWGVYQIETIQPKVGAVVIDLWRQTRQVLHSRVFQNGLKAGDTLMARCVAVGDLTTMTTLVSRIPQPFLDGLRKMPGFASDAAIAQDPTRQELLAEMLFAVRENNRQGASATTAVSLSGGNRQRNQPCPCGSGKKSKHCCARGR